MIAKFIAISFVFGVALLFERYLFYINTKLETIQLDVRNLKDDLRQTQTAIKKLKTTQLDASNLKDDLRQTQTVITKLETVQLDVSNLKDDLRQAQTAITKLETTRLDVSNLKDDLRQTQTVITKLETIQLDVSNLKDDLRETQTVITKLETIQLDVSNLKDDLRQTQTVITNLKTTQLDVSNLKDDLRQTQTVITKLETIQLDVSNLKDDLRQTQTVITKLETIQLDVSNLKDDLRQTQTVITKLETIQLDVSNLKDDLRQTQIEITKLTEIASGKFSFEKSTLYVHRYISSDFRTIGTHSIPTGEQGDGNGFKNYKVVRGTAQFTPFDIVYFEVYVSYNVIGHATSNDLLFEIGFSIEDTIDDHWFLGNRTGSWSLHDAVNNKGTPIELRYLVNSGYFNHIKTLSSISLNSSYQGRYGFYVYGSKGEITVIDKTVNEVLYKFEQVGFGKQLYPVFGVYNPSVFNVTLTLITGNDMKQIPEILFK